MFKRFMAMLDISLPLANSFSTLANIALIIGAVLVLLGTITAFWTGKIKERYTNERISANEAQTEAAKADVARAHENTELLRQSNLALQLDVERERVARIELEGKLAPRRLSDAQKDALASSLGPFADQPIDVVIPWGDVEARGYATDFVDALLAAGWMVGKSGGLSQATFPGPPVRGVYIFVNDKDATETTVPHAADQLVEALKSLGVSVKTGAISEVSPGKILLRIGSKDD